MQPNVCAWNKSHVDMLRPLGDLILTYLLLLCLEHLHQYFLVLVYTFLLTYLIVIYRHLCYLLYLPSRRFGKVFIFLNTAISVHTPIMGNYLKPLKVCYVPVKLYLFFGMWNNFVTMFSVFSMDIAVFISSNGIYYLVLEICILFLIDSNRFLIFNSLYVPFFYLYNYI